MVRRMGQPDVHPVAGSERMTLREAMETQRAIRRLKPDPVPDDVIYRCIELGLKAPTGSNAQNWEWIVVRDPEVKRKLARLNRIPWSVPWARRALGLPFGVQPIAVIPVGWRRGRYGPTTRRPVGDVVHQDRYGNRPPRSEG